MVEYVHGEKTGSDNTWPYKRKTTKPVDLPLLRMIHVIIPGFKPSACVEDLAQRRSCPVQSEKMGALGRWRVEHGNNSLENRNDRLKEVFDRALN